MAKGDVFEVDHASIVTANDRLSRAIRDASIAAIRGPTASLQGRLRSAMDSAVGGRAGKAFGSRVYPNDETESPAGIVYPRGGARTRGMVEYFTRSGWTHPSRSRGGYFAVPLPAAGPRGRMRDLTPAEWERRHGVKLELVQRRGKLPLLVAKMGTTNRRTGAFRPITRKRSAADQRRGYMRGEQTVPIFVLIPPYQRTARFSMGPMINATEKEIWETFLAKIRQSGLL